MTGSKCPLILSHNDIDNRTCKKWSAANLDKVKKLRKKFKRKRKNK